jgi:hypothetical protein
MGWLWLAEGWRRVPMYKMPKTQAHKMSTRPVDMGFPSSRMMPKTAIMMPANAKTALIP